MTIVDDFATVVATTGDTVYPHAVPKGTLPNRYHVVQSATPRVSSDDLGTSQSVRDHSVWVRTFATDQGTGDEQVAVRRCAWAADAATEALAAYRHTSGFKPRHDASQPAGRDRDQPDKVVAYASSIWSIRTVQPPPTPPEG